MNFRFDTPVKIALKWLLIALAIRIVALVVINAYSLSHGYGGFYPLASGHDDRYYFESAVKLLHGESALLLNNYPRALYLLFSMTGPSLFIGKFLNVFLGALAVFVGVLLINELLKNKGKDETFIKRSMEWGGFFLALYPSMIFYSTQLVKDLLLIAFGIVAVYFGVKMLNKLTVFYAAAWVIGFSGAYAFRFYAALAICLSLVIVAVLTRRTWGVFIVAMVTLALVPYFSGDGIFAWRFIPALDPNHMANFRSEVYSIGGSSLHIEIDYSNPITFLMTYGYSFIIVLFGPFPWHIKSVLQFVALPEAMVIWLMVGTWLKGIKRFFVGMDSGERFIFLFSMMLIGLVAMFSDNVGANTRLRLLPWMTFLCYYVIRPSWLKDCIVSAKSALMGKIPLQK